VKQRKRRVRKDKASKSSRTVVLDQRFTSYVEEMVYWLDFTPRTLRDYAKLIRKALSAGARVASWNPEYVEGTVTEFLEPAYEISKKDDVQVYQLVSAFAVNHLLLLTLGLVYDFFEDKRVERIDELTTEYEKSSLEPIDEYEKYPYAVLSPELANRASTLIGEILSVIKREDVKRRSDRVSQR
jgi:hypothetical protein